MTDTLQIIASTIGVGITIIAALVAVAWQLRGRLDHLESRIEARLERIENRLEDFGAGIRSLNQQVASVVGLLPTAFAFLHRSKAITDEEYRESVGQFTSPIAQGAESLIDHLARSMNPLTHDEVPRFRALVNKARRGELLSHEEAVEYNELIRKVQAERPNDSSIWPLVALGPFLSGLYLVKPQNDMH